MSAIAETLLAAEISAPPAVLRLRREEARDEDFRFALFRESRPDLALLPEAVRNTLLAQQFRAQTAGYAAQYPNALLAIVEKDGVPVGRVAVDATAGGLHLIDIAMTASLRGRGAGSAVLRALMDKVPVLTLRVGRTNAGACRLYRRLGFAAIAEDAVYIEMEWRARSH